MMHASLQGVEDELLVALYRRLEVANGQVLVRAVGNQDCPRAVQISSVISLEVGDVGSVVDYNVIEACSR